MTSLPLPGYQVSDLGAPTPTGGSGGGGDGSPELSFKVLHAGLKKIYYFHAESRESKDRLIKFLLI